MNMERDAGTIEIDMRGQVCPATMLVALEAINNHGLDLQCGAKRLALLTDNRDATNTIPDIAANMGYEVKVSREGSHYRILLGMAE